MLLLPFNRYSYFPLRQNYTDLWIGHLYEFVPAKDSVERAKLSRVAQVT